MKTLKLLKTNKLTLFLLGIVIISCVEDDDFNTPNTTITEPNIPVNNIVSINSVAGELSQAMANNNSTFTFEETGNYMEGYVISTDEAGNFFEELIIQDRSQNPTTGIRLRINVNPLFIRYEFGRKIFIKLDGLSVGMDNGVLTLGVLDGNIIGQIAAPVENDFIVRSTEVATIIPLEINLNNLSDNNTNLYINISDAQFNRFQVITQSLSFASEPTDEFDGERTLESCTNDGSIIFATSTFADFASINLPSGRGSINGILTRNFFGNEFNLIINSPSDINFNNDIERCDPQEVTLGAPINCDDIAVNSAITVFSQDFESYNNINDAVADGWVNENFNQGNLLYGVGNFRGNNYAEISGFNSNEAGFDVWLITPEINLDTTTEDVLNFDIQTSFNNGDILTVLVSTDYAGNIEEATWSLLEDVDIPTGSSTGFGTFEMVGFINTSCIMGSTVRFAFRYQGSDPTPTTRYHIDDISLTGN